MAERPNQGRREASAAIWEWRRTPAATDDRHARRSARRGALIGLLAGTVLWYFGREIVGSIALGFGSLLAMASVAAPLAALVTFERAGLRAGHLVGRALTIVLLTPVFFLVFVPFGLLFRRGRRDPLQRRREASATYWNTRTEPPGSTEHPF